MVRNAAGARIGDEVQISVADGVLLRGALKMYVYPLLLLLAGGATGAWLAGSAVQSDKYAVAGAVIGLITGFVLARLSPGIGHAVASSVVQSRSGH